MRKRAKWIFMAVITRFSLKSPWPHNLFAEVAACISGKEGADERI